MFGMVVGMGIDMLFVCVLYFGYVVECLLMIVMVISLVIV